MTRPAARTGPGETDRFAGIAGALGSGGADHFTGDELNNGLRGRAGNLALGGADRGHSRVGGRGDRRCRRPESDAGHGAGDLCKALQYGASGLRDLVI